MCARHTACCLLRVGSSMLGTKAPYYLVCPQGDVKLLTADVAELKPSIFVAVPRVLERIQGGIAGKLKAKPFIVRLLLNLAFRWKISRIRAGASAARVCACPPLVVSCSAVFSICLHVRLAEGEKLEHVCAGMLVKRIGLPAVEVHAFLLYMMGNFGLNAVCMA